MNIKKLMIIVGLTAALIVSGAVVAVAAETTSQDTSANVVSTRSAIAPSMAFTGTPIKLSLDETVKIMQTTGTGAQAAEINKKAADAVAKGYDEDYSSAVSNLKIASAMQGMIDTGSLTTGKKVATLSREYAKVQGPADYQAEMNKLESDAVSTYYGLLLAQENLKIAKDNLKSEENTLALTKKKFELGMVAKKDVLSAETAVVTAKNNVTTAESSLKSAKMGLNFMLGNSLMQEIELTDTLTRITGPSISLSDAIVSALENRSEIRTTQYVVGLQQIALDNLRYRYPEYSATYQKQYVAVLQAEKNAKDVFMSLEMEIRNSYMDLENKKNAIDAAQSTLDNVNEMYRLANISYNAGMVTLDEVQKSQIGVYQAALGLSKAINDYDLAVYSFNYAISVGTSRMM